MISTISKPKYEIGDIVQSFEEQLELFFSKELDKRVEKPKPNENLGQVFTSPLLAKFMIGLLQENINPKISLLDPCIGPNTFFKAIPHKKANCYLKGIEIDENLVNEDTKSFYNEPKRTLVNGSFFDLSTSEKFDLIIQNPPYVRQELLSKGINSKGAIQNTLSNNVSTIPSQSNLYIYFLLKAILHLKENGIMVAVIYDSWLYSSFGTFLKESFIKLGFLENIYHFKKSAFENIEVGATVIKFHKTKNTRKSVSYYSLNNLNDIKSYGSLSLKSQNFKQKELLTHSFNNGSIVNYKSSFFKKIKSIVSQPIQRGTSAIINKYFIFNNKKFPELKPIIKDVYQIKTYSTSIGNAYILALNGSISKSTKEYISSIKNEIINTPSDKYKAVKKNIHLNKNWYGIKIKNCGNFIFNYYLRNNIDFIYNRDRVLSSDNFYSININESPLAHLAILNSTFTKLSILNNSRSQGNGLRKIQLYEFNEIKVVDVNKISNQSLKRLEKLGETLANENRYDDNQNEIIRKIDAVLLKEYNEYNNTSIELEVIESELKEYIN
ncbi:Eco57I restriction-modification methylase domain-containing protein [Galbibacter sp. EGI 63066]|uniref:Eco57I restriction-modification methylase domain-containing protein n=1 Tax=Galbibacter sp. EGI 63066 TaxID=2993559 RepID=UPI002248A90D|nr:Eco57I restriction-modification methylase domain-containing protein [Galbibacter sp. EGI 63066]MCX2678848.1 Eco57I restriction-modification methylase domain-containing protein [Galbibacter sp. EGI 63066]